MGEQQPDTRPLGYLPGLDGVRGFAILLVLILHGGLLPLPFIAAAGVTVFFTLSGFLITRLLMDEFGSTGRVDLPRFYARRALRLLPALFLMLIVVVTTHPAEFGNALWAASYVGNWHVAAGYDGGVVGHSWSLAIEEQFYLLWPPILAIGLVRIRAVAAVCVSVAIVLLLAYVFAQPVSSETFNPWVEFSTFTQAPSILTGVLLALVLSRVPTLPFVVVGGAILVVIGAGSWPDTAFTFKFGYEIVALATVVLILGAMRGLFAARPLVALGRISYGIYVWHLPIVVWLGVNKGHAGLVMSLLAVATALLVAIASFRYVEQPFLRLKRRFSSRRSVTSEANGSVPRTATG